MGAKRQLEFSGPGKTFGLGCVQELEALRSLRLSQLDRQPPVLRKRLSAKPELTHVPWGMEVAAGARAPVDDVSNDVTSQMLIADAGGRGGPRSANLALIESQIPIESCICSAENYFPP